MECLDYLYNVHIGIWLAFRLSHIRQLECARQLPISGGSQQPAARLATSLCEIHIFLLQRFSASDCMMVFAEFQTNARNNNNLEY